MKILSIWAGALALALIPSAGTSQIKDKFGRPVDPNASAIVDKNGVPIDGGNPLPVAGRQEVVALVTANTTAPAATLYGGAYILTQACTAYGSVALRYRAPDGTMMVLATKIVGDTGGGTVFQFGTSQVVDVLLTGTTGCNVTLSRIP